MKKIQGGILKWAVILLTLVLAAACHNQKQNNTTQAMKNNRLDPHSYANTEEVVVKHIDLEFDVDFERKRLLGLAQLRIDRAGEVGKLMLDTKDLEITEVKLADGRLADFKLHTADPILGSALEITLDEESTAVTVKYTTSAEAEALQWLEASQTADKEHPFLFTQSQAILARSWIPLQDSPGVRFTYTARVRVPKGMLALMSAENPQEVSDDGIYEFSMPQPIPSYLMSLAVGDIAFAAVGERTGVYAEPGVLTKARAEFSEMDEMLLIAEDLYGAYQWGRYDLMVLPPSFPFGGMENPRITFATPTILAGDKSLTSLVAHELAHSWSGNLVTNATWNDFWLNEGFTVYFETRIMEALKGRDYSEMLAALSMQGLQAEVEEFIAGGKEKATTLKLDLAGQDPDDGMNTIAYDKGYLFLRYLEEYVGREVFDAFLKQYFTKHAFQSNTTEAFVEYLNTYLFEDNDIEPIDDLNEWVYGTGLPQSIPSIQSERFARVDAALELWKKDGFSFDTTGWSSHEWVHFLKNLPGEISLEDMEALDRQFAFTNSGNAEILGVWFVHCARNLYQPAFGAMELFLVHTGRRKFLMPIFTELIKTGEGRRLAIEIYKKARPNYHFVAYSSLDKLLGKPS
jgi:leukotriene-A4 hydrolase